MVFMAGQVTVTNAGGWDWGTYGGGYHSGQSDCPDCPDAWDKQLTEDRFELVMPTEENEDGEAVRDNETCLVWERFPDRTEGTGKDGYRPWAEAYDFCIRREVGGRHGWRLPSVVELASLGDDGPDVLPEALLLLLPPYMHERSINWTTTTSPFDTAEAYFVYFGFRRDYTRIEPEMKTNEEIAFTWCVRGGPEQAAQVATGQSLF